MSSKRIQKRLDQLFIDIKQAEEPSLKPLIGEPSGPEFHVEKTIDVHDQKTIPIKDFHPEGRSQRSQMGPRALEPVPQELIRVDQNIESNTITLPFRTGTDTWSVLE